MAIVTFVGRKGGYGNVVTVRHPNGYTTLYAHLSGFAQGLRQGKRVVQGEVVGFVGSTGLATGPHLHYEFHVNGVHQNPMRLAMPPGPPITAQLRPHSKKRRSRCSRGWTCCATPISPAWTETARPHLWPRPLLLLHSIHGQY